MTITGPKLALVTAGRTRVMGTRMTERSGAPALAEPGNTSAAVAHTKRTTPRRNSQTRPPRRLSIPRVEAFPDKRARAEGFGRRDLEQERGPDIAL